MKYGDTLRQRSIPEWGYFNIDYDFLKDLIKHHTTPGAGTAVSIPGQGDTTEQAFSETFFKVLRAQHDRINLFIKSKRGEIERRLNFANDRLRQIQERQLHTHSEGLLRAKTVERYAKIDADVSKAGEEIRCLARFRVAQCTGFYKILKKYKRWTNDQELEARFKVEVTENPDSFFRLDLGYLLDQYIDVLHAVRSPLEQANTPLDSDLQASSDASNAVSRIAKAIDYGSEVDFDSTFSAVPLGSRGSKATYWIHPDHILETEVLLLQHMRLHSPVKSRPHSQNSPQATPPRRTSSTPGVAITNLGNEDEIGLLILDNPDNFAQKNKSVGEDKQEREDAGQANATGYARWSSVVDVAAVHVGVQLDRESQCSGDDFVAKLKRKQLYPLLSALDHSAGQSETLSAGLADLAAQSSWSMPHSAIEICERLAKHKETKPLVGICAKRTRFVGIQNCPTGCVWATLDRDIDMKSGMLQDLMQSNWISASRKDASKFPHAVLEIRGEGRQAAELIQILDHSHLVERIRGFSLEVHAVWTCCKPTAMTEPFWIPMLEKDIRKLPEPVKRRRRKPRSTKDSISSTPPLTSASTVSVTDEQASPNTLRRAESSATSGPELPVPTLKNFRKKSTRSYSKFTPQKGEQPPTEHRYWNEYDDPESSEEEGYYIYVNPDEEVKFPGQETIEKWATRTKQLFRKKRRSERSPLMSVPESPTSDEETTDESVNDSAGNYGTMARSLRTSREGYFSSLFRSFRDPHRDAQTIASLRRQSDHERRNLVSIIETRQHEREMTKLRLYSTCIAAAVVIDIILLALTSTSRRKERGVVDGIILFGTISNLILLVVALLSMTTRHERLGWVHQGFVLMNAIAVVVVDVLLFNWVLSP
jgi:SPX domain protein involved in polyphosphate accumulation